jgi:hypothetical protein
MKLTVKSDTGNQKYEIVLEDDSNYSTKDLKKKILTLFPEKVFLKNLTLKFNNEVLKDTTKLKTNQIKNKSIITMHITDDKPVITKKVVVDTKPSVKEKKAKVVVDTKTSVKEKKAKVVVDTKTSVKEKKVKKEKVVIEEYEEDDSDSEDGTDDKVVPLPRRHVPRVVKFQKLMQNNYDIYLRLLMMLPGMEHKIKKKPNKYIRILFDEHFIRDLINVGVEDRDIGPLGSDRNPIITYEPDNEQAKLEEITELSTRLGVSMEVATEAYTSSNNDLRMATMKIIQNNFREQLKKSNMALYGTETCPDDELSDSENDNVFKNSDHKFENK